jgi:hypothetical protein
MAETMFSNIPARLGNGPLRLARGQLLVGQGRAGTGLVSKHAHQGVQRRVHLIDASQMRIHHFHRAQTAGVRSEPSLQE